MRSTHVLTWNDLPAELILEIFEYLDFQTLKIISLVNKQFLKLSQRRFRDKAILNCFPIIFPLEGLSARNYDTIHFKELEYHQIESCLHYFDPQGNVIKSMMLEDLNLYFGDFYKLAKWSKSLSSLSLRIIHFNGYYVERNTQIQIASLELFKLRYIPPVFTCLSSLNTGPFYIDSTKKLIEMNKATLKHLNSHSMEISYEYDHVLGIENLESLELSQWHEPDTQLTDILKKHSKLKCLRLPCSRFLTDISIAIIVELLKEIEILQIECSLITDYGLAMIMDIKSLKKLHISSKEFTENGFSRAFSKYTSNLIELVINNYYMHLNDNVFGKLLKNAPSLRKLHLQYVKITIKSFVQMARSFKYLKKLILRNIEIDLSEEYNDPIPEFESLEYLDLNYSVSHDSISYLKAPKLKVLKVIVTKFNVDDAKLFVTRCPIIQDLVFRCITLTDDEVDIICQGLPRLRRIIFADTENLSSKSLQSVVIHCKQLTSCQMNLDTWVKNCDSTTVEATLKDIAKLRTPEMNSGENIYGQRQLKNMFCEILV